MTYDHVCPIRPLKNVCDQAYANWREIFQILEKYAQVSEKYLVVMSKFTNIWVLLFN